MPLKRYERENILKACFEIFVLHGYVKTTTSMLAEVAGISKSLIFHHFGSKKKLYMDILRGCFHKMAPQLDGEPVVNATDFFEAKDQNGRNTIEYMRKNPKVNRLLFEAFYSTPHELKQDIHQLKTEMEETYGGADSERKGRMMKLFDEIPLREGVDRDEAYQLIHIVSEYFRMKLAAEVTDPKKMNDDVYWESFFERKKSFLEMVRFGIQANQDLGGAE